MKTELELPYIVAWAIERLEDHKGEMSSVQFDAICLTVKQKGYEFKPLNTKNGSNVKVEVIAFYKIGEKGYYTATLQNNGQYLVTN